ncbi:hypothetical protein B4589_017920 (plasmid) [Halolamina sp. CBA1230]|uniref:hypothetical protein n=1 Tax=Halolamina sp. CBA1230 TaxID=1853690 RepID=UPI00117B96C9|nr:hypothetical protein [Halolamina sp. CBA1230]QKY22274.1 hypothetical protein B4589_017920 [Halolamina sp. CBA1230]
MSVLGTGGITLVAGCSSGSSSSQEETRTSTDSSTPTPTPTPPQDPILAGFHPKVYGLSIDVDTGDWEGDGKTEIDMRNKGELTIPAIYYQGHEPQDNIGDWSGNIAPDRYASGVVKADQASYDNSIFSVTVYPQLWPESPPDRVPAEFLQSDGSGITNLPVNLPPSYRSPDATMPVLHGSREGEELHIPLPEGIDPSSVSELSLKSLTHPGPEIDLYMNSDETKITVDDSAGIRILPSTVPTRYFGRNPYWLSVTGITEKVKRLVTFPMPDISIANVDTVVTENDGFLEWKDLSYDLTVGETATGKFEVATFFELPNAGLVGETYSATVSPGTTTRIQLADQASRIPLPIDNKDFLLTTLVPYPVAQHTTTLTIE